MSTSRVLSWLAAGAALVTALSGCGRSDHSSASASRAVLSPAAGKTRTTPTERATESIAPRSSTTRVPRFDHIVVAVVENHSFDEVLGSGQAPFLQRLASAGAVLTQSYAVTHPSEPNYLALFSGSTQGLTDDSCPHSFTGPNLASELAAAGRTFAGYSDSLPSVGYPGCSTGSYARKHNPWVDFPAVPAHSNQPMTAFPQDFAELPTVSFVIPDLDHDMHDGTVTVADSWLKTHLGRYAAWATRHNSLLVLTADEDDSGHDNHIPTMLFGAHVKPGAANQRIDHYGLLRTLLDSINIPTLGYSATAKPLSAAWIS